MPTPAKLIRRPKFAPSPSAKSLPASMAQTAQSVQTTGVYDYDDLDDGSAIVGAQNFYSGRRTKWWPSVVVGWSASGASVTTTTINFNVTGSAGNQWIITPGTGQWTVHSGSTYGWVDMVDTGWDCIAYGGPLRQPVPIGTIDGPWTNAQRLAYARGQSAGVLDNRRLVNHRGAPARSQNSGRLFESVNREEVNALHLLRQMVDQAQFRRYLRHGFVVVRGASGLEYQIRRNAMIQVWDRGEKVATLCVHLRLENRPAPPTDHVVGKLLIVESDEIEIWKRSNISWDTKFDRPRLEALGLSPKGKSLTSDVVEADDSSGILGALVHSVARPLINVVNAVSSTAAKQRQSALILDSSGSPISAVA